ncbi:MAG: hypothetical protein NVSMB51_18200 [Solirubrobacteraceae bacterium]
MPTPTPTPQTSWTAVGAAPGGDAQAAALVTHRPEVRPANAAANNYVPSDTELNTFRTSLSNYNQTPAQYNPLYAYVTGRPGLTNPSTDDLIQWTAHKWGIPEDVIRAEMVDESSWNQSALGDRATVSSQWLTQFPTAALIPGTSDVYESMGVMQIKWRPDATMHPGAEPLRWKSTAFNLDYFGASVRYYYDGYCGWCTAGYAAGQQWNSIGAWYDPSPWNNAGQQAYIARVQANLSARAWAQPGF